MPMEEMSRFEVYTKKKDRNPQKLVPGSLISREDRSIS